MTGLTDKMQNRKRLRTHGMSGTTEYRVYTNAKNRCNSPKNPRYADYGGRGIEFRFDSFKDFYAEVGDRPSMKHTLDRIDNNGHYEVGNVRWATRAQQYCNTRRNRYLTVNGEVHTLEEWSRKQGMWQVTIYRRLKRGWCEACAVMAPSYGTCHHVLGGDMNETAMGFIVELHGGCWLAGVAGDPGRTLVQSSAKVFKTIHGARTALGRAKVYRNFPDAVIIPVNDKWNKGEK